MLAVIAAFVLYVSSIAWRPLIYAGFLVQSGYLAWRGITLGRIPLIGVHDTLNFLAASLVAFGIAIDWSMQERTQRQGRSYFMMLGGLAAFFTGITILQQPHSGFLPPVLKTYWFELHVTLSFFSYALFGLGAILGIMYLREGDSLLERTQYRAIFMGYSLFSLSMVFGAVWAWLAWGTYWLWTPKELWTVMLWLYYSLYLHSRLLPRWNGRPASIMGTIGFVLVLFTYLGVGLLMKSSHSFN
jgi:ABC-type transport system involved in cytochrome c biogenesis permease subunit